MSFADHFSKQAAGYSHYRPRYPAELYTCLSSLTQQHEFAWDCATGNGQAARTLASLYNSVEATDASEQQIAQATPHDNIHYHVCEAGNTPFPDNQFDLITVAQALHWFDLEKFYAEVKRVSKPGGIFAAWCYGLFNISPDIDKLIYHFYNETLGPFWPKERKHIHDGYASLAFPFERIAAPDFFMSSRWKLEQLLGYLGTWSAARYYREHYSQDPVRQLASELQPVWSNPQMQRDINWPIFLHVGRVIK
jgi:SAM-dependent methyltransferase